MPHQFPQSFMNRAREREREFQEMRERNMRERELQRQIEQEHRDREARDRHERDREHMERVHRAQQQHYLDRVEAQFSDRPDAYDRFLDIMEDFKSQA